MTTLGRYRDVEELLFERGIDVSRESIRTWCINFSSEFAQHLSTGHLDFKPFLAQEKD